MEEIMNRVIQLLGGVGIGSGLMYFFDPELGRRRRSLVRDQFVRGSHELQCSLDKSLRDMGRRAQGFAAELRGTFTGDGASDRVLVERVRSKLGRYVSHPRAIEVYGHDGCIYLGGPILADEVEQLIEAARSVPGVCAVENHLDVHEQAGNISALQGGRKPAGERWNIAEGNWAPATRLSLIVSGAALSAYALSQRFPTSCILGTIGLGACLAAAGRGGTGQPNFPRHRTEHASQRGAENRPLKPREEKVGLAL
jgi:hypothetical protein